MAEYQEGRRGVRLSQIYMVTGSKETVKSRLRGNLDRWHDDDSITDIYIGKTSAARNTTEDVYDAMNQRIDDVKDLIGTTDMKWLYVTENLKFINDIEKAMIEYSQGKADGKNRIVRAGGGGNLTTRRYKVLYVALTIT